MTCRSATSAGPRSISETSPRSAMGPPSSRTSSSRTVKRGSLLTILKAGGASTLDIVARVKAAMPLIKASLPDALNIDFLFDQSVFVRHSIEGVLHEAAIAAVLTGMMILLFLGSWRSTLIVTISIPLSIMISILILSGRSGTRSTR